MLFCLASDSYLEHIQDIQRGKIDACPSPIEPVAYFVGLYILLGGRILLQAGVEFLSSGFSEYSRDHWNWFDIAKALLLLATRIVMQSGHTLDNHLIVVSDNDFEDIRVLMALMGFFLFFSLIVFLRKTFLPFSNSVTGMVGK